MKKTMSALALTGLVAACVPTTPVPVQPVQLTRSQTETVKSQVVYDFKDPATAQFRNIQAFRVQNGDIAVCGEVNGKNSFGAYIGYKPFYIRVDGQEVKRSFVDNDGPFMATAACNEAKSGTLSIATSELAPPPQQ